jgi:hypothetical protein
LTGARRGAVLSELAQAMKPSLPPIGEASRAGPGFALRTRDPAAEGKDVDRAAKLASAPPERPTPSLPISAHVSA